MRTNHFRAFLAVAAIAAFGVQAHARHVTHPVTPANIDKQPYAFAVKVTDADKGQFKQFEITVKRQVGKRGPGPGANGELFIRRVGKKISIPRLTTVKSDGEITFTFRIPREEVERFAFTFTESPGGLLQPFPSPGDFWVFDLSEFVKSK